MSMGEETVPKTGTIVAQKRGHLKCGNQSSVTHKLCILNRLERSCELLGVAHGGRAPGHFSCISDS